MLRRVRKMDSRWLASRSISASLSNEPKTNSTTILPGGAYMARARGDLSRPPKACFDCRQARVRFQSTEQSGSFIRTDELIG